MAQILTWEYENTDNPVFVLTSPPTLVYIQKSAGTAMLWHPTYDGDDLYEIFGLQWSPDTEKWFAYAI